MAYQYSFEEMQDFASGFADDWTPSFDPHLLLCIFWEETAFRNIRNSAGAVGFGQVTSIKIINDKFRTHFTAQGALDDPAESTALGGLYLMNCFETARNDRDKALLFYAGQQYKEVVGRWVRAFDALQNCDLEKHDTGIWSASQKKEIAIALNKCSNGGYDAARLSDLRP